MQLTEKNEEYFPEFDGNETKEDIEKVAREMCPDALHRVDAAYRTLAKEVNSGAACRGSRH